MLVTVNFEQVLSEQLGYSKKSQVKVRELVSRIPAFRGLRWQDGLSLAHEAGTVSYRWKGRPWPVPFRLLPGGTHKSFKLFLLPCPFHVLPTTDPHSRASCLDRKSKAVRLRPDAAHQQNPEPVKSSKTSRTSTTEA